MANNQQPATLPTTDQAKATAVTSTRIIRCDPFGPPGDLRLRILDQSGNEHIFVVDSGALSRTSPVFRDLLADSADGTNVCSSCNRPSVPPLPTNTNAKPVQPTLDLAATDPPRALEIVLKVAHGLELSARQEVNINAQALTEVIYIGDKYEMLTTMRLPIQWWLSELMRPLKVFDHGPGTPHFQPWDAEPEVLLDVTYFAYILGDQAAFDRGLGSLAWTSDSLTMQELVGSCAEQSSVHLTKVKLNAGGIEDRVRKLRDFWLTYPLNIIETRIQDLKASTSDSGCRPDRYFCKGRRSRRLCDRFALDHLEDFLSDVSLFFRRAPDNGAPDLRNCSAAYGRHFRQLAAEERDNFEYSRTWLRSSHQHLDCDTLDFLLELAPWDASSTMSDGEMVRAQPWGEKKEEGRHIKWDPAL